MEGRLHVMLIKRGKTYNRMTMAVVERHIEHIRKLDDAGLIELCGPTKGFPGVAGMVILKSLSYEEAEAVCKAEPLVSEGYATYTLCALQVANRENNYLME